jgi:ABC-type nitrate/sulfonate/bicarbonate transport system permease component
MVDRRIRRSAERALGVAVLLICLLALEIAVRLGKVNAMLVPPPSAIAQRTFSIVASGAVAAPLGATLTLLFSAFFGASALAIAVGLAMGRFKAAYNLFEPLIEALRPLPKTALVPPLILLLGLGSPMKLTVVGLGVFFPVVINTIQGVRGVDPVLVNTARTFGLGPLSILRKVILPAAMPLILVGMRVSLAIGLILVVVAEMLAGTGGLGYLILDMQRSFKVLDMYAWLLILATLGYVLNDIFVRLESRATHWAVAKSA